MNHQTRTLPTKYNVHWHIKVATTIFLFGYGAASMAHDIIYTNNGSTLPIVPLLAGSNTTLLFHIEKNSNISVIYFAEKDGRLPVIIPNSNTTYIIRGGRWTVSKWTNGKNEDNNIMKLAIQNVQPDDAVYLSFSIPTEREGKFLCALVVFDECEPAVCSTLRSRSISAQALEGILNISNVNAQQMYQKAFQKITNSNLIKVTTYPHNDQILACKLYVNSTNLNIVEISAIGNTSICDINLTSKTPTSALHETATPMTTPTSEMIIIAYTVTAVVIAILVTSIVFVAKKSKMDKERSKDSEKSRSKDEQQCNNKAGAKESEKSSNASDNKATNLIIHLYTSQEQSVNPSSLVITSKVSDQGIQNSYETQHPGAPPNLAPPLPGCPSQMTLP